MKKNHLKITDLIETRNMLLQHLPLLVFTAMMSIGICKMFADEKMEILMWLSMIPSAILIIVFCIFLFWIIICQCQIFFKE